MKRERKTWRKVLRDFGLWKFMGFYHLSSRDSGWLDLAKTRSLRNCTKWRNIYFQRKNSFLRSQPARIDWKGRRRWRRRKDCKIWFMYSLEIWHFQTINFSLFSFFMAWNLFLRLLPNFSSYCSYTESMWRLPKYSGGGRKKVFFLEKLIVSVFVLLRFFFRFPSLTMNIQTQKWRRLKAKRAAKQ